MPVGTHAEHHVGERPGQCRDVPFDRDRLLASMAAITSARGSSLARVHPVAHPSLSEIFEGIEDGEVGVVLRAIEEGRVVDENGQSAPWRPMMMVLAVSGRLKGLVDGDEYENAVRKE